MEGVELVGGTFDGVELSFYHLPASVLMQNPVTEEEPSRYIPVDAVYEGKKIYVLEETHRKAMQMLEAVRVLEQVGVIGRYG